jgi:LysM repeat protein
MRAEHFVLEDDDEEEEDGPPSYDEVVVGGGSNPGSRKGSSASGETSGPVIATDDAELNVQEPLKHRIQKGETIRSIANRYAMDVSHLPPYIYPSV